MEMSNGGGGGSEAPKTKFDLLKDRSWLRLEEDTDRSYAQPKRLREDVLEQLDQFLLDFAREFNLTPPKRFGSQLYKRMFNQE